MKSICLLVCPEISIASWIN